MGWRKGVGEGAAEGLLHVVQIEQGLVQHPLRAQMLLFGAFQLIWKEERKMLVVLKGGEKSFGSLYFFPPSKKIGAPLAMRSFDWRGSCFCSPAP